LYHVANSEHLINPLTHLAAPTET